MRKPARVRRADREPQQSGPPTPGLAGRVLLGVLTACCLFAASSTRIIPHELNLVEGDTAPRTIRAPRSGVYVDEEATERLRLEAERSVPEVYDADPAAVDHALTAVDDIFARIAQVRADPLLRDRKARVRALQDTLDVRLSPQTLELAVSETTTDTMLARLHATIASLVRQQMNKQIRANTDDLVAARRSLAEAVRGLGLTSRYAAMAAEVGKAVLKPNLIPDPTRTQALRQEKRAKVREVTRKVQAGEVIILAGEQVRPRHVAAFAAVGLMQATFDYYQAAGLLLTLLFVVFLLGTFMAWFASDAFGDYRQLITVAALLVLGTFAYRGLEPTSWFEPGALTFAVSVAMVVSLVMGPLLAVALGICLALLLPVIATGGDARLAIVTALCTTTGAFIVAGRGSKGAVLARAAFAMAGLDSLMLAGGGELFGMTVAPPALAVAAIGGLGSPLLAMGAALALERMLGVVTDFRLMELGNPHEPILHRYISEAPGSYQASLMVAHLAEMAAEAVGANGLLVRTAAIYHDIGKMRRPYFFVENQFSGENPHERLSPHLSALVITAHVKEGCELADKYGLPSIIKDFIREHHGTTLVQYFYQRALELADDPEAVHEADFRYPGPKPQSRETAILMLADTVEAAARTLDRPSPHDIQEMVERLVDEKVRDHQLDESPLSFKDLVTVKQTLVNALTGMYHQRVKYPEGLVREARRAQPRSRTAPRRAGREPGEKTEAPAAMDDQSGMADRQTAATAPRVSSGPGPEDTH